MTDLDKKWTTYERAKVKTEVPLKVILPFDRPDWIPNKCFVWWYELLSKLPYSPTCPQEEGERLSLKIIIPIKMRFILLQRLFTFCLILWH